MLWVALAVMTGLAIVIALWPLAFRRRPALDDVREADFHRAQLAEIARDVERGLLLEEEAASARAEAGRRLIAATSGDAGTQMASGDTFRRRAAAVLILVAAPAVSFGVYGLLGQPRLADEPLAERRPDSSAPEALQAAIAKVEAHLMTSPDDKAVWAGLAPVYMRLGRFADAAGAYRRVLALGDDQPGVHANLGEALVAMSEGAVTSDARDQFEAAVKAAPDLPMPRFYLALAAEQDGRRDEAKRIYGELAPAAKGRMPWMIGLRARLAALESGAPADASPPGPGAEASGKAAPSFSPDQRQMIEGMVQGLASRLAQNGGSADEWGRLIRAYSVLQQTDKARDALASARKALGANADIDALARELGI